MKNLNDIVSLLTLIIILIFTLKFGLGLIFSSHHNDTFKGNLILFNNYRDNEEE